MIHKVHPHLPRVIINEDYIIVEIHQEKALVVHTSKWITSKALLLTQALRGNACLACLPIWNASHTFCIPSTLNFGKSAIILCVCIDFSLYMFMCPMRLSHISIFAVTPLPCANITAYTFGISASKVNILPFLLPDRKSTRLNSSHSGESRMPSSA